MTEQIITKELLDELFEYKNGSLYWKVTFIELAELIAIEAREKYHGIFANHG